VGKGAVYVGCLGKRMRELEVWAVLLWAMGDPLHAAPSQYSMLLANALAVFHSAFRFETH
jgi:hypothetical protein